MISVSPPGQQERKARDLNPHGLAAARFSKSARQTVSGYPPKRVDPAGVEPALPARQAGVVPLDHRPVLQSVETTGVEPVQGACEAPSPPRYMRPRSLTEVRPGLEPGLPRLPGRCAAATLPDRRKEQSSQCWCRASSTGV